MATTASSRTTDHDEIRRWVEERGGIPSVVSSTHDDEGSGLLRIDFPGFSGEGRLEPITWEEFFAIFDENDLEFLHQDRTADGEPSRFNKFVARER